jgi:membrane protein YdbS with pleckstrin-like domain
MVVRPSMKPVWAGYAAVVILAVAASIATAGLGLPAIAGLSALVLIFWPLASQIRRSLTRVTIHPDKIVAESGLFNRTTRMISMAKVQDVQVRQSLMDRLWDVGLVTIETAGETALEVPELDAPTQLAAAIMDRANHFHQRPPIPAES